MADNPGEYTDREIQLLWKLISDAANQDAVRELLKAKGLPSSAPSWPSLYELRVRPALTDGTLTGLHLIEVLRDHEEYGRQAVFLYRCSGLAKRLRSGEIQKAIGRLSLHSVMRRPLVLDKPKRAQIVDLRLEPNGAGESFVVKVVSTRESRRQVDERTQDGRVVLTFEPEYERVVHLLRLRADGLLEVRIQFLRTSKNYRPDLDLMRELASDILPFADCEPVALWEVKRRLWESRSRLAGQVRFRQLIIRNPTGTVITIATGSPEDDLAADQQAVKCVDQLLRNGGHLEEVNMYWLSSQARPLPARNVHVILSGEINQLTVPAPCSKDDYKYVLERIVA